MKKGNECKECHELYGYVDSLRKTLGRKDDEIKFLKKILNMQSKRIKSLEGFTKSMGHVEIVENGSIDKILSVVDDINRSVEGSLFFEKMGIKWADTLNKGLDSTIGGSK